MRASSSFLFLSYTFHLVVVHTLPRDTEEPDSYLEEIQAGGQTGREPGLRMSVETLS